MTKNPSAPGPSYLTSHTHTGYGSTYNKAYSRPGYYRALWERVERPLLQATLVRLTSRADRCLDFACGTGRITSVACSTFNYVVGVDVSQAMLSENSCGGRAALKKVDLCKETIDERFDVALAFRFFLNADPELRAAALKGIHRHLNDGALLVCNIHMQSTSPMGGIYGLLKSLRVTRQNTLSTDTFIQLLERNGFELLELQYYGFLPRLGPLFPRLAERLVVPAEKLAQRLGLSGRLAQSCLIVAKRAASPSFNEVEGN